MTHFENSEIYIEEGKIAFCLNVQAFVIRPPISLLRMTSPEPRFLPNRLLISFDLPISR